MTATPREIHSDTGPRSVPFIIHLSNGANAISPRSAVSTSRCAAIETDEDDGNGEEEREDDTNGRVFVDEARVMNHLCKPHRSYADYGCPY